MAVDTITQRSSDFTDRDFDSWVLELRSRVSVAFPGWTDFNCYSEDTEVLTRKGWLKHYEVGEGEEIAAFDQSSGAIRFVVPTAKHVMDYSGQMVHVRSKHVDVLVTPNHRMLVKTKSEDWHIECAEELLRGRWITMRTAPEPGTWEGEHPGGVEIPKVCKHERGHNHDLIEVEDWAEFLGYFVSDGGLSLSDHVTSPYVVFLRQKKEPCRSRIRACLDRIGWTYSESTNNEHSTFTISNRCLRALLLEHCGSYQRDRRLPWSVLRWSKDLLEILYQAMLDGDGSRPTLTRDRYYSGSQVLTDQVQMILTLLGNRTLSSWSKGAGVWITHRTNPPTQTLYTKGREGRGRVDLVDYHGTIYCYEVPEFKLFVTRRNGRVGINGNTANFGNILLEMFAHTLDVLSFTQDQQHLERFVTFARLRRSMILLGKNVGFELPGAKVGTVDLEISFSDGLVRTVDLIVPKGTVVTTTDLAEQIEFDLTAAATIAAGTTQITTAAAENARERTQNFVADGSADQRVRLTQVPFVDASVTVTVGVSAFTEVSDFLQSGPTDKVFRVDVDQKSRGTIVFGDGINGEIPSGAGVAIYKTGGGASGNVDANTLTAFRDGNRLAALDGKQIQLTVRNPLAVADGVDRMSVEEARVAIPASIRTVGSRSVTRDDFEDNARKVRGVARAMMLTADDVATIPENTGQLYVVPVGGGLPSGALKTQVKSLIDTQFPATLTFAFTVLDPTLLIVSITATVFLNKGITEPEARLAIEAAYDSFFALLNANGSQNSQIDFGFKVRTQVMPAGSAAGEVPFSDLFAAIREAVNPAGKLVLRKVDEDVFTPVDDVALADTEFPILGSIGLVNGDTTLAF